MSTLTAPAALYRPKRLPRVLRRQAALIRLLSVLGVLAVIGLFVAWRNFTYQQLTIDTARQRSQIMQLEEENRHLNGLIEAAAPYPDVANWAQKTRGWKARKERVDTVFVKSTISGGVAK
ncbi:MAG: hypothetical protein H6506_00235 [Calditrichaeota bacterium]|nr:hypothetical protein [Calditrichota bacterium]MCB9391067.1 hypothetical protein [Calditrichota bacterium]